MDFFEDGDAPAAAGSRTEAVGHLTGAGGAVPSGEVPELAKLDVVAAADFVVGFHGGFIVPVPGHRYPAVGLWTAWPPSEYQEVFASCPIIPIDPVFLGYCFSDGERDVGIMG